MKIEPFTIFLVFLLSNRFHKIMNTPDFTLKISKNNKFEFNLKKVNILYRTQKISFTQEQMAVLTITSNDEKITIFINDQELLDETQTEEVIRIQNEQKDNVELIFSLDDPFAIDCCKLKTQKRYNDFRINKDPCDESLVKKENEILYQNLYYDCKFLFETYSSYPIQIVTKEFIRRVVPTLRRLLSDGKKTPLLFKCAARLSSNGIALPLYWLKSNEKIPVAGATMHYSLNLPSVIKQMNTQTPGDYQEWLEDNTVLQTLFPDIQKRGPANKSPSHIIYKYSSENIEHNPDHSQRDNNLLECIYHAETSIFQDFLKTVCIITGLFSEIILKQAQKENKIASDGVISNFHNLLNLNLKQ